MGIVIAIIVFMLGMILCLFPRNNYNAIIDKYSNEYRLDKAMVYSVINIESGFDVRAESSAGAKGLMQLLPSTAMDCANRIGIEMTEDEIFDEDKNIRIGCFYLSYLLNLFEGNLINTLSAYNWGLGNVKQWVAFGNVDKDGTIINIPVRETQNYIRKYRINYFIYKKLFNIS